MKCTLLLTFSILVFLFSCKKNDDQSSDPKNSSIVGKWKITGYTYGNGTDYFNTTMPLCEKDNLITYTSANKVSIDEGGTKCDLADPQTVTETYTISTNGININTYGGTEGDDLDDFEIILLNTTTLKLKDTYGNNLITYLRQP